LPSQLADHTVLSDPRQPSLLHLAIRESNGERRRFDLLMTDLPGEWTDNLVLHATYAEAFRFLQRADGIILIVDGKQLMSDQHRHTELQRMRYFSERLAHDVNVSRDTPFVILVSKSDEIGMQMPPAANDLRDHVAGLGFPAKTISAAAFSRTPDTVKSGTGVFSAIETILSHPVATNSASSPVECLEPDARIFRRFRG
jgi:Double-GTPase 2